MQPETWVRKLDKAALVPVCPIMNVNIAAIDMPWLVDFICTHVQDMAGDYITVANVHTTVTAWEEPDYCRIQNGGMMAIPDGGPLSTLGRRRGFGQMQRTTGPSLMEEMFRQTKRPLRHYFYGSSEDTLQLLRARMEEIWPQAEIAGMYSPPFRPLDAQEDAEICDMINATGADIVWVGLGAPKQERWMAEHQGRINGLMIGVGAGFDYHAGKLSRAPQWMQRCNLEWLYRLLQEPRRLFRRYLHTNLSFIWHAVIRGR